jgi:hypothetical protein
MNIDRRALYAGVFFIAMGGVLLIGQSALVSDADLGAFLRLWPVLLIALGAGLLLRRTRFSIAGGMLAAAIPGLLLGGVVAAAPRADLDWEHGWDCTYAGPIPMVERDGTFDGPATVDLDLACGEVAVTMVPGRGWVLGPGNSSDRPAIVEVSGDRLVVASPTGHRPFDFERGSDAWRLELPTGERIDLDAEISGGHGSFDLGGAELGRVVLGVNGGEIVVGLDEATLEDLFVSVNAGEAGIELPDADFSGDLDVNAGSLAVCAPSDLGLRIRSTGTLASTAFTGLVRVGETWQTPGYDQAIHHADVTVTVNVGSVDLNPKGACK